MWVALGVASIAAVAIYTGMPIARSRRLSTSARSLLQSVALGVLVFVCFDIFGGAQEMIVSALVSGPFAFLAAGAVFVVGLLVGGLALPAALGRLVRPSATIADRPLPAAAGPAGVSLAPLQLSMLTAVAIGIHTFSEGLAVGAAFAGGLLPLSVLLSVGVVAHKSAEGYCICGCAADAARQFSSRQLALLGAIGGGPVVLGALVGGVLGGSLLPLLAVFGLAVGALLNVAVQMLAAGLVRAPRVELMAGILIGLVAALTTDLSLTAAGL